MIEWQQASLSGDRVPVIHGQALASLRSPADEAQKWLRSQNIQNGSTLAILGFGCGAHVECLQKAFPDCRIVIYELHAELGLSIPKVSVDEIDQVLEFRPAWGAFKDQYLNLRTSLLGDYRSFQEFLSTLSDDDVSAGKIIQEFIR